ncbi:1,3-beta-glucanosyltransferase Gas2 [Schizosaccharomyces japonicus yFS275]|uniref:1,3-beta-glucanosyltransferase n=1 Tax=Schizosaccharomyces japonicus (strain yFS275 / FY16936) TaxID=402676 RepID=B6JZ13_SCHJY|nr:1,3-beta-glucanosyltransferase Gas2 [Schizosaccharomyces japonicus yFS275]EEB06781.1 1,3-beta-glucanosyltransferase Gas2 [Schizosaccharomyces japonicus yFS275]
MMSFGKFILSLLMFSGAFAMQPLSVKGRKFFVNDTQFYLKGVAYQPNVEAEKTNFVIDPLAEANKDNCTRDAKILSDLGANSIRVYAVNASLNHDKCMQAFSNQSIYVFLDLANPKTAIDRSSPTWNIYQYANYTKVIDAFAKYNNTAGFFAGNEVVNNASNSASIAYVRAAIRDSKSYIKANVNRSIPVGYAGADIPYIRTKIANYLACNATKSANDTDSEADFLGYNIYEWCGKSDYVTSGYKDRTEELKNYTVPLFFSEFGCNLVRPRLFTEVAALYGSNMTDVWSGGIVYEYTQETNGYGLINTTSSGEVVLTDDYKNLKKQWAAIKPTTVKKSSYKPSGTAPACPAVASNWEVTSKAFPVTPNATVCSNAVKKLTHCTAKGSPDGETISDTLSELCYYDSDACSSISSNPEQGTYGKYSACSGVQQLSFALDAYTSDHGNDACSWGGVGTLVKN